MILIKKNRDNITKGLIGENGDPLCIKPIDLSKNFFLFFIHQKPQFTNSCWGRIESYIVIVSELNEFKTIPFYKQTRLQDCGSTCLRL